MKSIIVTVVSVLFLAGCQTGGYRSGGHSLVTTTTSVGHGLGHNYSGHSIGHNYGNHGYGHSYVSHGFGHGY